MQVIKPTSIQVGIIGDNRGPPISEKATTMFLFLMLSDIYRMTVTTGRDQALPEADLFKHYKGLELRATPKKAKSMTTAHLFFGISWIWLWMANLVPEGESNSGFFERIYVILKRGAPVQTQIGFVMVHNGKLNPEYIFIIQSYDE